METGFDKEIDLLLRTASETENASEGGGAVPHLEVDFIASYAENVLPPPIRKKYSEHFADCARCRNVLANLIAMNAAAGAEAAVPARGGIEIPRAKRFLFIPAPVFALSALLVIFGGFLLYSALQVPLSGPAEISGFSEPELPMRSTNDKGPAASNVASESSQPSAANTAANDTSSVEKEADRDAASPPTLPQREAKQESLLASKVPTPPPTVSTTESAVGNAETKDAGQPQALLRATPGIDTQNARADEPKTKADEAKISGGKAPEELAKSPPAAVSESDEEINGGAVAAKRRAKERGAVVLDGADSTEARTRTIAGKTFENRGGVWFDSEYKGQGAAEIGRGTDAYLRLDARLRAIADKLKGTVVVVWKKKAYRID